jgi:tetratricopeptide (TPR) repeat protein
MPKDVFVGRKVLSQAFRESVLAVALEPKEPKGLKLKKQKESQTVYPQVFVFYGEAGTGKSAMVRQCVSIAAEVELETKKGLKTIVLDFEDPLFTRNVLPFTPRMMVHYLHTVLTDPALGVADRFSEYLHVERRLEHVIAVVSALRRDEWLKKPETDEAIDLSEQPAQKAASQTADAVNGAPPHARMARQEAEAAFLRWLREEKRLPEEDCDLFENADYRLTKALVNGLVTLSAERPLLLAIDNLDRVANPNVLQWMRSVFLGRLFDRKNRVVAVVSGREKLLRSYRNEFPEELLCAVSFDDLAFSRWDVDECNQALHLNLGADAISGVEEATGGVPVVVRDVLTYAKDGGIAADVLDGVGKAATARDKMATIVMRFCAAVRDERTITRVVHLAMLTRADAKILSGLWKVPEGDVDDELLRLSEHYPFVAGGTMHDGVAELFRRYLINQSTAVSAPYSGIIKEFGVASFTQYNDQLCRLQTEVAAPDKRFLDERYEAALLGCITSLLWYDQSEVERIVPGHFCECLVYNQVLAGRILAAAEEFAPVLRPELVGLFNSLSSGLLATEGQPAWSGEKPSSAELAMLASIGAAGASLSSSQQAILCLRRASCAYRSSDFSRALDQLEKCEPHVDESELLRDLVLEGYSWVGSAFGAAQQHEMAIKAFGRAAEIRPDRNEAWHNLGCSYAALKRHVQAEDSFAKAVACKPESYESLYGLGSEQFALAKFGDAAASFGKAAALKAGVAEVWHMLGLSNAAVGRHPEAIDAYKKALAVSARDAACWFDCAVSQAAAGNAADAAASCKKALELDPAFLKAALLLGQQLCAQGKFSDAVAAYQTATRLSPRDEQAWYGLGCALLDAGEPAQAVGSFIEATKLEEDFADAFNKMGLALVQAKDLDGAVAAYNKAVKSQPAHFEALNNLGNALAAQKKYKQALKAYVQSTEANPGFEIAWYNRGIACNELGRYQDALEPFAAAARLAPDKYETWFANGLSLFALEKYGDAAQSFVKAAGLSPESYDAWYKAGTALAGCGKYDDAVAALVKAAALSPDKDEALHALGVSYAALGRHNEAVDAFAKTVAVNRADGAAWRLMGVSHQAAGRFAEAVTAYREAVKVVPGDWESWHNAGLCSYYQSRHGEAIELLSKALELSPDNKDTLYTLGLSQHAQGNYGEAARLYARTLEVAPGMANARTNLALSLHASGSFAEAVAVYKKIAADSPGNADAWHNMGLAAEAMGNSDEAMAAYGKAVEVSPDRLASWVNRGNIQMSLERYADAIASFTKAVELAKDNAESWGNLALASYYIGHFGEAVSAYERAIELAPDNVRAWGSLGLTYYTMGNYAKAIEASEKALSIKPDELWIQVNLALAAVLALNLDKAKTAFEKIIEFAASPEDLLHPIASLKELLARNPNLAPAREILVRLEDTWRKLKK